MPDFHHYDDARDIWMAVKARFGGNEESKKMKKTMLKQQLVEFSVTDEEGLHKGYDRFQKILSQLNQVQARPDNDDINLKFLRALPSSWSQVALALKTRGGLESMSFDDLYNKLRSLELDVRIGHSYGVTVTAAVAESAFIGISPKAYQNAVKTLESQKDWYHKTQIALEEKIRILSANLENTTNTLSYTEKLHDQAQKEKKEWEVKTKIGLGFKEYGKDEVFDLSTPSVMYPEPVEAEVKPLYSWFVKAGEMHAVPPSITGTYMPIPYKSNIEETQ
ncbi:hypothetical protein Tco_1534531 [Tanacetum coccineum]